MRQIAIAAVFLIAAGCGKVEAPKPTLPTPAEKKEAGLDEELDRILHEGQDKDEAAGATRIMVKNPGQPVQSNAYYHEERKQGGILKGLCVFKDAPKGGKDAKLPQAHALNLRSGPFAIPDPKKDELEYFENLKLAPSLPWTRSKDSLYPRHVVLHIHHIRDGSRPHLSRATYLVRDGQIGAGSNANYSEGPICFGRAGDKIYIGTYDKFPTDVILSQCATGKVIDQGEVTDYVKPKEHSMNFARPEMFLSKPLAEPGVYSIASTRHPWKQAWYVAVENPYVAVASGAFTIDGIPPGNHTLEAWHPLYAPEALKVEIEIKVNAVSEVRIELPWKDE